MCFQYMSAKAFVKHEAAEQEDVDQQDVVEQKADSKPYYQPSVRQHRILLVTVFLLVLTEEIHQLNTKLASTAAARDRDSLQADKNGMAGAVQALQLQLAQLQDEALQLHGYVTRLCKQHPGVTLCPATAVRRYPSCRTWPRP